MGGNGLIINIVRHYLVLQFKFLLNSTEMSHQTHGRLQSFLSHKCMGVMFSILTWIIYWFSEKMVLLHPKSACGVLTMSFQHKGFNRSVCLTIYVPTIYLLKMIGAVGLLLLDLYFFLWCKTELWWGGMNKYTIIVSIMHWYVFFSLLSIILVSKEKPPRLWLISVSWGRDKKQTCLVKECFQDSFGMNCWTFNTKRHALSVS
jgi:hypothetical protein